MLAANPRPSLSQSRATLLSIAAHAAVFVALAVWSYRAPRIAHFKLPGTAKGITLLTYYSPGSRQPSKHVPTLRNDRAKDIKTQSRMVVAKSAPVESQPLKADPGTGDVAESGVGDGDVSVALLHSFPTPQPDLSALPHGAGGDVILNAVIDEHGKITALTLLKGLAPSIDEAVIATVKDWSFTPATKDGIPVVSEQELHFHYQRA